MNSILILMFQKVALLKCNTFCKYNQHVPLRTCIRFPLFPLWSRCATILGCNWLQRNPGHGHLSSDRVKGSVQQSEVQDFCISVEQSTPESPESTVQKIKTHHFFLGPQHFTSLRRISPVHATHYNSFSRSSGGFPVFSGSLAHFTFPFYADFCTASFFTQ